MESVDKEGKRIRLTCTHMRKVRPAARVGGQGRLVENRVPLMFILTLRFEGGGDSR